MNRREFLKSTAVAAVAAAGAEDLLKAAGRAEAALPEEAQTDEGKLLASAPMLQNYAETGSYVNLDDIALAVGELDAFLAAEPL